MSYGYRPDFFGDMRRVDEIARAETQRKWALRESERAATQLQETPSMPNIFDGKANTDPDLSSGSAPLTPLQQYPILRFFHYEHLPLHLRTISSPFCDLAMTMVRMLPRNAETSTMLRKLLEAKDCAVRAQVGDGDHPAPKEAR